MLDAKCVLGIMISTCLGGFRGEFIVSSERERNDLVYKSNELIEGRYRLTAVAQKIAASTISRVNPIDKGSPLPSFKWSIAELSEISGVGEYVLRNKLSSYTKELKAIVVELRKIGSKSYQQLGLFRVFTYDDDEKHLEIEFEDRLEGYIRDFSHNFTRYQLIQIQKLVSGHSVRIYEILRMAYNRAKVKKPDPIYESSLEELKAMLGIKKDAYSVFANFRRKVLEVAQKELNEKSDITFEIETLKKGRKIAAIRFHIRHNEQQQFEPVDETGGTIEGAVLAECRDDGMLSMLKMVIPSLPDEQALLLVNGYNRDVLTEALMDLSNAVVQGAVKNPVRYFMGIMKNKRVDVSTENLVEIDRFDTSWAEGLEFEED